MSAIPSTSNASARQADLPIFDETRRWLDIYFSGKNPSFTPPLLMRATSFRKAVWEILLTIPYGKTTTYGEIAAALAQKRGVPRISAQAVGNAVGHNAISLIIPCHRVIGANGGLTGYAAGIDRKACLLDLENGISPCW
ncbi:MAG: methylated-DNA--[protein]-cysteine S-methyltransferase [bacterium]|nr:methylated-DNA--[protein]-cysteine S-methyltransferase [bacterium]